MNIRHSQCGRVAWILAISTLLPLNTFGRQIAAKDGLSVHAIDRSDWCQSTVELTVRANNVDAFKGDRVGLQRALAQARFTIEDECPAAASLRVIGYVAEARVFDGQATKAARWALVEAAAPASTAAAALPAVAVSPPPQVPASNTTPAAIPSTGPAITQAARPSQLIGAIQQCDLAAAHPDDPEAFAKGVPDDKLNAQTAIAACEAAVKIDKDAPRLAFQLARAYLKAERFEDATDQLLTAAKQGHGGALAYLADLHVDGAPGVEADPALAHSLYKRAAEAGFAPAEKVLAQFEDFTEKAAAVDKDEQEETATERTATSKGSTSRSKPNTTLVNPTLVEPLITGNPDGVAYGEIYSKAYMVNMLENIVEVCPNQLTKPTFEDLRRTAALKSFDMSTSGGTAIVIGQLQALGKMMQDPYGHVRRQTDAKKDQDDLPMEAMSDAFAVINKYSCTSPELSRLTNSASAYIRNEGAPLIPTEQLTRKCMKEAEPTGRYDRKGFCMCFISAMTQMPVTRAERKSLSGNFWTGAQAMYEKNKKSYDQCFN